MASDLDFWKHTPLSHYNVLKHEVIRNIQNNPPCKHSEQSGAGPGPSSGLFKCRTSHVTLIVQIFLRSLKKSIDVGVTMAKVDI